MPLFTRLFVLLGFVFFSECIATKCETLECLLKTTDVYCGYTCVQICFGSTLEGCFEKCYNKCVAHEERHLPRPGWMGHYLQANTIQHVGVTVKNITRITDFFVNVLGGVLAEGAGGDYYYGDTIQQLLTQKELLQAKREGKTLEDFEIADLFDAGTDTLAVRFVNFGSLQVEILDYRARTEAMKEKTHLPYYHHSSSPSIVNNMHFSFRIRDDVDMDQFVVDFEEKCNNNGYPEVECNRIIAVANETERKEIGKTEPQYNSFEVNDKTNPFDGWGLVYCKGPEGIQFEFNTIKRAAKKEFDIAFYKFICGDDPACYIV